MIAIANVLEKQKNVIWHITEDIISLVIVMEVKTKYHAAVIFESFLFKKAIKKYIFFENVFLQGAILINTLAGCGLK